MSYANTEIDNVLMLRWDTVTVEDVERVGTWIRESHQRLRKPIVYIAVVPEDSPIPPAEARRALLTGYDAVADLCATVRLVILGSGFSKAAIRAVSAGLLLAIKGKRYSVDDHLEDAAEAVAEHSSTTADQIVAAAREAGIILDGELVQT